VDTAQAGKGERPQTPPSQPDKGIKGENQVGEDAGSRPPTATRGKAGDGLADTTWAIMKKRQPGDRFARNEVTDRGASACGRARLRMVVVVVTVGGGGDDCRSWGLSEVVEKI